MTNALTIKATHKSSVTAILGEGTRPVYSCGTQFLNRDRWTGRALLVAIADDVQANPNTPLTVARVDKWVRKANEVYVYSPNIQIADTPDSLNDRIVGALIGGAYHEAWHTKYSCRRDLTTSEVMGIMKPRWAKVRNWANFASLILEWSNIVEDVRIERLGVAAYPGTHTKMCDLQDFILDMEAKGNAMARAHGAKVNGTLSVIGKTFRDLGLGYNTNAQRAALAAYQRDNPMAYNFTTTGAVGKALDEAIKLSATDDLGCLRVAFDVLIAIADASQQQPQPQQQQGQGEGKGQQDKSQQGKGQQDKQPKAKQDKGDNQQDAQQGDDGADADGDDGDQQGKPSKQDKGDKGDQSGKGDDQQGDKGDDATQGSGGGSDGDDKADSSDKGDDGQGDDAGDDEGDGDDGEGEGDQQGDADSDADDGGDGAGGRSAGEGKDLSEALRDELANGDSMGMKDNNAALSDAFNQLENDKLKQEGGVQEGEAPYRPADKTLDRVVPVAKARAESKRADADKVLGSVKDEVAYLRARLRNVFRAAEMTATVHGTRTGRTLSDRMLVDSRVALMGGNMPSRAYQQPDEQVDMSLACAIVIDQSGSMHDKLVEATQAMMAIAEPMDAIGAKVQATGFRDGQSFNGVGYYDESLAGCHQTDGVDIDMFKDYDERFASVKSRFACTRATGGTPMANGIQFALNGLNNRREGHRVLFVITDGEPNWGHGPVVKRQIRVANEAGIHVIGVGIGNGAKYVTKLFPDYVYSPDMKGLPQQLIAKVNGIVDRAARKRGVRMKAA